MSDDGLKLYTDLGYFVYCFANAESVIHSIFPSVAQIKPEIAMAFKGAMRVKEVMQLTKQLMRINAFPEGDLKVVEDVFAQFVHIANFRDTVLHRGVQSHGDGSLHSSNWATTKSPDALEVVWFSSADISNASHDLSTMPFRLLPIFDERMRVAFSKASPPGPWLYKPLKPETPNRPLQSKPRARARPPKASRGKS